MLELVPYIKEVTRITYETPIAGYDIPAGVRSHEEIMIKLKSRPEHVSELLSEEKWQALLLTWIATIEKAKRLSKKSVYFNSFEAVTTTAADTKEG